MTGQEIAVAVIGLGALAYLVSRYVIRKRAATCCGEKVCPAVKLDLPTPEGPRSATNE